MLGNTFIFKNKTRGKQKLHVSAKLGKNANWKDMFCRKSPEIGYSKNKHIMFHKTHFKI